MERVGDRVVLGTLGAGAVTRTLAVQRPGEPVRAAKRLLARFVADPEARAMLAREAAVLSALCGRGAPQLADRAEDALGPYFVMELLPMSRLALHASRVPTGEVDFWDAAARVALDALCRVHEATDARGPLNVIHGDLSADNVLVADDASAGALVDFGLARFRDDLGPELGPFRGTLSFAAPEVARGEAPSVAADLFSLAASVLASASGEPPRTSSDFAVLLRQAAEAPIDAFAERASARFGARLATVLRDCVRFGPRDRPGSAREALAAL